ncbi:MAG: hypothetical protein IT337_00955 [Thermomicrobiales bacterium]|nr:hypothetical protein [Thermomicrobiales bacterium]
MVDIKKTAGLLGGAMVGVLAAAGAAAQEMPTTDAISADVNARVGAAGISIGDAGGTINVGGSGGGSVSTGGGTATGGNMTGGDSMNIGGNEGLAIADASGGNHNVSFVS